MRERRVGNDQIKESVAAPWRRSRLNLPAKVLREAPRQRRAGLVRENQTGLTASLVGSATMLSSRRYVRAGCGLLSAGESPVGESPCYCPRSAAHCRALPALP